MKKKVRFPSFVGTVAADPKAIGLDFFILDFGRPAYSRNEGDDYCVIDVCGPLVQHNDMCFPSYDGLRANFLAACGTDASTIVLRVESPGGDFAGCLELSKWMRQTARAAGKRVIAFTDSQALSAAYAISCAADDIVTTPSGFLGSIGVWAPLQDQTALDRAMGLRIEIIASGDQKAERNPHVPITDSAKANLQIEVDAMADLFFEVVAQQRGLPKAKVIALQGAQRFGESAVSSGLADHLVNDWSEFISRIDSLKQGATPMASSLKEMRAGYRTSLAKKAAEDSDEGREAASELAAWDKEEAKKAKKADADGDNDGDKEAKAKAEDEEKKKEEARAAAKAEEDKEKAKALAASQDAAAVHAVQLAGRVQALEAQIAADKLASERATLLNGRSDFSAEVRKTLSDAPIEMVRKACAEWPRIPGVTDGATTAAQALTPGATQGTPKGMPGGVSGFQPGGQLINGMSEGEFIDRKTGRGPHAVGVRNTSRSIELGYLSPDQVREANAALDAAEKGGK